MAHHSPSGHGQAHSVHDLERGNHQEDGVEIGSVLKAGLGLAVITVITYGIVFGIYQVLSSTTEAVSTDRRYPLSIGQENRLPPEPRLQVNPKQELKDLRARELDTLDHYGWVDKNAGVARIPIENAMKLTLERGLPARSAQAAVSAAATAAPAAEATAAAPAEAARPQEHR